MASQSQQWKDIQIFKEDAQKIVDTHLKDIHNACPIVNFRELPKPTYRWVPFCSDYHKYSIHVKLPTHIQDV